MEARHTWPLYGLRLTTPRLELSVPGLDHLAELAEVAAGGLHEDGFMPFSVPWSATSPRERARGTFQHLLGTSRPGSRPPGRSAWRSGTRAGSSAARTSSPATTR